MHYLLIGFGVAANLAVLPVFAVGPAAATPEATMTKECGACHPGASKGQFDEE
jgi:hypothetical protein